MLVAFVSLRIFTLRLRGYPHPCEEYLRYITKASNQAPHLESFTIHHGYDHTVHCKRTNENWVVCDAAGYPPPWEYVCVLSKGSMFVHDLFFRYLHLRVHEKVISDDGRRNSKCRLCLGALSLGWNFGDNVSRLNQTARSHSTNMSSKSRLYFIIALPTICCLYQFF